MQSHIKTSIVLGVFLLGGFVAHAQEREGALMPSIEEFNQMTVEEKMKFFQEDYQALAPDQKELVREKLSGVPAEGDTEEDAQVSDATQQQNEEPVVSPPMTTKGIPGIVVAATLLALIGTLVLLRTRTASTPMHQPQNDASNH
jgi:hypothetical protein